MDIISLAPNITDIIMYYNKKNSLIGCTTNCDTKNIETVGSWMNPDFDKINDMNPDIVFTSDALQKDIKKKLKEQLDLNVYHTEPTKLSDIIRLIGIIGSKINVKNNKIKNVIDDITYDIKGIVNLPNTEKIIYCEEWDNPPMVAGNWVPDMVNIAGGKYPYVNSGERSKSIKESDFKKYNPDIFVSHICGGGLKSDFRDVRNKWDYNESIYFVDDKYFNRLSTNTIQGIKILTEIITGKDFGCKEYYNIYNTN